MQQQPLSRCRVLYLSSSVPTETTQGIESVQEPLRDAYPVEGDEPGDLQGIDAWLSVFHDCVQLQFIQDPGKDKFFPINTLHYCCAVRYAPYNSDGLKVTNPAFVYLDSADAVSEHNLAHPPCFAAIFRETSGRKVLNCHTFVCKTPKAAMAVVQSCSLAYKNAKAQEPPPVYYNDRDINLPVAPVQRDSRLQSLPPASKGSPKADSGYSDNNNNTQNRDRAEDDLSNGSSVVDGEVDLAILGSSPPIPSLNDSVYVNTASAKPVRSAPISLAPQVPAPAVNGDDDDNDEDDEDDANVNSVNLRLPTVKDDKDDSNYGESYSRREPSAVNKDDSNYVSSVNLRVPKVVKKEEKVSPVKSRAPANDDDEDEDDANAPRRKPKSTENHLIATTSVDLEAEGRGREMMRSVSRPSLANGVDARVVVRRIHSPSGTIREYMEPPPDYLDSRQPTPLHRHASRSMSHLLDDGRSEMSYRSAAPTAWRVVSPPPAVRYVPVRATPDGARTVRLVRGADRLTYVQPAAGVAPPMDRRFSQASTRSAGYVLRPTPVPLTYAPTVGTTKSKQKTKKKNVKDLKKNKKNKKENDGTVSGRTTPATTPPATPRLIHPRMATAVRQANGIGGGPPGGGAGAPPGRYVVRAAGGGGGMVPGGRYVVPSGDFHEGYLRRKDAEVAAWIEDLKIGDREGTVLVKPGPYVTPEGTYVRRVQPNYATGVRRVVPVSSRGYAPDVYY